MPPFIGSQEHKELLCRFFTETFLPYEPSEMVWPDLDAAARQRLADLPIWEEAVKTEAETALAVQTMGRAEKDPLMAKAIAMQGYEEGRHAELLRLLTRQYDIPVPDFIPKAPEDPLFAFMRIGYGECFDSFFAFGLFALARDSGFFPPSLVRLFEPIMQEEGRHIIFHVNWVAFNQAQLRYTRRPQYVFKRGLAIWLQVASRIRTALRIKGRQDNDQDNFAMKAHASFGDITPRRFLELCLSENEKRLKPYDARLLRPALAPGIARVMVAAMPADVPVAQAASV
jgi:hypothetical protein